MTHTPLVDVLIFEDRPDEVGKLARWLGLSGTQYRSCTWFADVEPGSRDDEFTYRKAFRIVSEKIREVDPRVVVFDYLLSGQQGDSPYNGAALANECKAEHWPEMGAILATTGGDGELTGIIESQTVLDEINSREQWPLDFAWIKPWGPNGEFMSQHVVEHHVRDLIRESKRPSEHG
jgi:hypothetical protein